MCAHPAKHVTEHVGKKRSKERGGLMSRLSILPEAHLHNPHLLYYPPEHPACCGGQKATSALWGVSGSSPSQATLSWVNFGTIFTVASRISQCFTEQISPVIALNPFLTPSQSFISSPGHASGAVGWGRRHPVKWATNGVGVSAGLLLW